MFTVNHFSANNKSFPPLFLHLLFYYFEVSCKKNDKENENIPVTKPIGFPYSRGK